ncbi:MAG: HAMP domain-containing sensor histidine kinase [Woeseiaceae bacterium]|nr:HAMP domain-containing sensor histidine kinase [Woeseiaceae bacterium]
MPQQAIDPRALEAAFAEFNLQSGLLEECYRSLQDRVAELTERLRHAQSERHRELLEKERLSNRLSRLLETLPGAILVIDGDGVILERNRHATDLLRQPLLGCCWAEVVQREFQPCDRVDGDLELRDGRWVNLFRRPLDTECAEILLLTDVTETRRMTKLLERQERLSALGEMSASLAHQIRTPLASAMLYLSNCDAETDAANGGYALRALDCLRTLDGLVSSTLDFAGGSSTDDDVIIVSDLLQSVVETILPQLGDAQHLSCECEDAGLAIEGNRDSLHGALLNLVSNALETGPRAQVELGASVVGDQVWLMVSDDGDGIQEADRERLFEPFYTTRRCGTGLGLAIVRSVARAHGGDVVVESGSLGSTFAMALPRRRAGSLLPGGHRANSRAAQGACVDV